MTTIVLLLLYALGLSVATFVEKYQGTAVAQSLFYHSALFIFLQALLVENFLFGARVPAAKIGITSFQMVKTVDILKFKQDLHVHS